MSYLHEPPLRDELDAARALFSTYSGRDAQSSTRRCIDRLIPAVLVDLGALRGIIYSRDHGGATRTYIHFMDDPPRLTCDAQGRTLYVVGGSYRVTRRGIEG
jgi:hypothetical protein